MNYCASLQEFWESNTNGFFLLVLKGSPSGLWPCLNVTASGTFCLKWASDTIPEEKILGPALGKDDFAIQLSVSR